MQEDFWASTNDPEAAVAPKAGSSSDRSKRPVFMRIGLLDAFFRATPALSDPEVCTHADVIITAILESWYAALLISN